MRLDQGRLVSCRGLASLAVAVAAFALVPRAARAASCTTQSFSETFASPATYEARASSVINWQGGGPILPTHKTGAFPLSDSNPQRVTLSDRLIAADANAMYLFGKSRNALVGLANDSGCQLVAYGIADATAWYDAPDLSPSSRLVIDASASCGQSPMVLTGDVAGDTNVDIVTISPTNVRTSGEIEAAWLYVRNAGSTSFRKVDISAPLKAAKLSIHSGTPAALGDVDLDGTADLLVASSHGSVNELWVFYANDRGASPGFANGVKLIDDLGLTAPIADAGQPYTVSGCVGTDAMVSRGATALAFGDVDGDLVNDVVVGAQSEYGVHWFRNTGRGQFVAQPARACFPDSTRLFLLDLDGDGLQDLAGIRWGGGCNPQAGRPWARFNDGQSQFLVNPDNRPSNNFSFVNSTLDWGGLISMPVNFVDGVQVTGGAPSLIGGKANGDSRAALFFNLPAGNLYPTSAIAVSKPITQPKSGTAIVQAQIDSLGTILPSGTSIDVQLSADDGQHWEPLTDEEKKGSVPHFFSHFGQSLRWRALFTAPATSLESRYQGYLAASKTPPKLSKVAFRYTESSSATYSRSKLAYASIGKNNKAVDHVLQASFVFPGFVGHLQAQDLSAYGAGDANSVQTLSPTTTWDAANQLARKAAAQRNIFTVSPQASTTQGNMVATRGKRIAFSAQELQSSSTSPSLLELTGLDPSRGASYINLLRDQTGNTDGFKLRDPGHSSPVPVLPPGDDPGYLGHGYDAFVKAQSQRPSSVLMGANDGMLHAFDLASGDEQWAFVPSNLLGKMQAQLAASGGKVVYRHDAFVDGPIATADVFVDNQWKTIAVVGQGEGSAASGTNYYHALDVTDPSQCLPLWEMTEGAADDASLCNPDPCAYGRFYLSCSKKSCNDEDQKNFGELLIDSANKDGGATYGKIEAEHFDNMLPAAGLGKTGSFAVMTKAESSRANSASNGRFIQAVNAVSACTASDFPDLFQCPSVEYRLSVGSGDGDDDDKSEEGTYTPVVSLYNAAQATGLTLVVDDAVVFSGRPTLQSNGAGWQWARLPAVFLNEGRHTVHLFMRDPSVSIDQLLFTQKGGSPNKSSDETAASLCQEFCSLSGKDDQCISNPDQSEWSSACGTGSHKKCCAIGKEGYCTDIDNRCGQPPSRMGQTFSAPAIGRIRTSGGDRFVAVFASGYNAFPASLNVGRSLYMVDAYKGTPMASWNLPAAATDNGNPDIATAVPGSVSLVDADNDGYVDRLYVGDLSGRLWKLNLSATASLNGQGAISNQDRFATCVVFDAGSRGGGARIWAPIITKPAVAVLSDTTPNVYFGTGGDSRAPTNVAYSFFAVRDTDAMGACSNTGRNASSSLAAGRGEWKVTESANNGRFWADPVLVDGTSVVFSSYVGSPDAINPCRSDSQSSHLYGVAAKPFTDASGVAHAAGTSVWSNNRAFFTTTGVVRTAAIVRGQGATQQVARAVPAATGVASRDLLFQQFTGELLRIASPGVAGHTKRLHVVRIREISL